MGSVDRRGGAWAGAALWILAGCQGPEVRAVLADHPRIEAWVATSRDVEVRSAAAVPDEAPSGPARGTASVGALVGEVAPLLPPPSPAADELLGSAPAQLDPEAGPVDLGYPLLVDLGAGEAPYDDGVPTLHGEGPRRGGFSDSVLQVHWRHPLAEGLLFHGGASLFREQDLSILDGLPDARFGWAVVGLQIRF